MEIKEIALKLIAEYYRQHLPLEEYNPKTVAEECLRIAEEQTMAEKILEESLIKVVYDG